MDESLISETLDALASPRRGRGGAKTLRGARGVPSGEVARIAAAAWEEEPIDLYEDRDALGRLFSAAFEDGLVAIGLIAAKVPDEPEEALDIAREWLGRVDDTTTADALGWLVLGPAALAFGWPVEAWVEAGKELDHPAARRAVVMAGMAMTPEPLEGPSAAPLRARVGQKQIRFVETALNEGLAVLISGLLRDPSPEVRKGLRRVIRAWTKSDAAAVVAWADGVRGGLPKLLGSEVDRARRLAARRP